MNLDEQISIVRIEYKAADITMTRIGTRRVYAMKTPSGPLMKKMRPGQVWRVRWHNAGLKHDRDMVVLIDANPIASAWMC